VHLIAALHAFRRLGAAPWAARAAEELRATGHTGFLVRQDLRTNPLRPQEHQIATLAASGLSNRQIGEKLFLSHRTVAAHLHQIYAKLGINSRVILGQALAELPPRQESPCSTVV
jgi:DNA-binding NarL/FixJ family response regulator